MSGLLEEVLFDLKVSGVSAPWRVARVRAVERLSELFECDVEAAPGAPLDDLGALLGRRAVVELARGGASPQTHRFAGLVARVTDRGYLHGDRVLALTVVPSLWLLAHRSDCRVFENLSARDVVAEVLRDAGLYQSDGELTWRVEDADLTPREYCTQYNETDLDFVRRLLEDEGLTFRFDVTSGEDRLTIVDATLSEALTDFKDANPVLVMGQGGATADSETVRACDDVREVAPASVTLRDYDFTRPDFKLHQRAHAGDRAAPGLYEFPAQANLQGYSSGSMQYNDDDLRRLARARLDAARGHSARSAGRSNLVALSPGDVMQLFREDASEASAVLVTAVEHVGQSNEIVVGTEPRDPYDRYANTFDAVPAGTAWRPPRTTPRPRALTPQLAVVVGEGSNASAVETDEYGRVLVRFRWDWSADRARPYRPGGTRSSCWLRVAQLWAGEGWGVMFTPRVGMEVLVQFIDGDPDRPVVTGCLYNGTHRPPLDASNRSRSVIRTQSTDGSGFNELLFEDLPNEELVSLRAQRDLKVEALHDREVTVGRDDLARVTGDATLSIDGRQRVTVKGDRTTELKARETLTVDGDLSLTVHGGAASQVAGEHQLSADEGFTARSGGGSKATLAPDGAALKAAEVTVQATRTLTLRCAGSVIEMSAQGVKITAADGSAFTLGGGAAKLQTPAGAKLALEAVTAELSSPALTTVKGALVKIN